MLFLNLTLFFFSKLTLFWPHLLPYCGKFIPPRCHRGIRGEGMKVTWQPYRATPHGAAAPYIGPCPPPFPPLVFLSLTQWIDGGIRSRCCPPPRFSLYCLVPPPSLPLSPFSPSLRILFGQLPVSLSPHCLPLSLCPHSPPPLSPKGLAVTKLWYVVLPLFLRAHVVAFSIG